MIESLQIISTLYSAIFSSLPASPRNGLLSLNGLNWTSPSNLPAALVVSLILPSSGSKQSVFDRFKMGFGDVKTEFVQESIHCLGFGVIREKITLH